MSVLVIDDRDSEDTRNRLGTSWAFVPDGVMGGRSRGQMTLETHGRRPCLCLTGTVTTEGGGGFLQMATDLVAGSAPRAVLDARTYRGLTLTVRGNGARYELSLKTADAARPWQSYRAPFAAPTDWTTHYLPFSAFTPHRMPVPLNPARLRRLGIIAAGGDFEAEVCLAYLALEARDPEPR
jgi:hypothetical protein